MSSKAHSKMNQAANQAAKNQQRRANDEEGAEQLALYWEERTETLAAESSPSSVQKSDASSKLPADIPANPQQIAPMPSPASAPALPLVRLGGPEDYEARHLECRRAKEVAEDELWWLRGRLAFANVEKIEAVKRMHRAEGKLRLLENHGVTIPTDEDVEAARHVYGQRREQDQLNAAFRRRQEQQQRRQ